MIGKKLGQYEVIEMLGEGGMGVVYRAHDSSLNRDVAIKVLPKDFVSDPERKARFAQEARILATLNAPNIASIYGLQEAEGQPYLAMELVEGQTLAERINKGRIPLAETLDICLQIAEGLEAAHDKGIVHRDLKPANIIITPEGKVKILDFGLAKSIQEESLAADISQSPTFTRRMTQPGVILGTASYMSPEQARGKVVDKRSDIWAFGVVLYEMLTGQRLFQGETVSDVLASVLKADLELSALPADTPTPIRRLLRRALHKDPRQRLGVISDARLELDDAFQDSPDTVAAPVHVEATPSPRWFRLLPWALAGMLAIALIFAWWPDAATRTATVSMRSALVMSSDTSFIVSRGMAISPDGSTVVFAGGTAQSLNLYIRRLDEWGPHLLPQTQGAASPFFSPDGRWIAFWRNGLWKMAVSGGAPQVICKVGGGAARWLNDNTILFGRWPQSGLWRVSADGGEPQAIAKLDEGSTIMYMAPEPLPGNKGILFTLLKQGHANIAVLRPGESQPRLLVESGSFPRYLPTGHLVYVADKHLLAVRLDLERMEIRGTSSVIVDSMEDDPLGAAPYDVSARGALIYKSAEGSAMNVVWRDRKGVTVGVLARDRQFQQLALSPDGERFSVVIREGYSSNIWAGRITDEPLTRLTFGNGDQYGVWSKDSQRLLYMADQSGTYNIFSIATDGSGKTERITQSPNPQNGTSFSPDGDILLYNDVDPSTRVDIWELSLSTRKARPLIKTPFDEFNARFSPDGRWFSYRSYESGQAEVYVQAYPGPGIKKRVSLEGGLSSIWSHNGRELFYQTATALFAVPVLNPADMRLGTPQYLFDLKRAFAFEISTDDQRFLMLEPTSGMPPQLNLVQNWFEELQRLVPTGKN